MNSKEAASFLESVKNILLNNNSWLPSTHDPIKETFDMAIKALEQEPCEDAISRVAAIDKLDEWDWQEFYLPIHFKELLDELPPVRAKEKTGHWEFVQYDSNPNIGNWHCSECNRIVCGAITAASPVYSYKYCPNCGAKMQEETETCKDCMNKCIMYEPNMKGCKDKMEGAEK